MNKPLAFVIEEDENLSEMFAIALQLVGFETEIIADSELAQARLEQDVPHFIILNASISGVFLLTQIRGDRRLADTPVVVVTAEAGLIDVFKESANVVFAKPIPFSQISRTVKRLHARYVL